MTAPRAFTCLPVNIHPAPTPVHQTVSLLTQPPSPPEEPAPPSPKDKDSSAFKKKPSKGKAAAGGPQVDSTPPSSCSLWAPPPLSGWGFSEDRVGGTDVDPWARGARTNPVCNH